MRAFEGAVALGYRYVETDARATADGVLLAFHDERLDRTTDGTGRIAELPYARVSRARVGGTDPIPLLEDVLGAWPDLRVNIDPKHDAAIDPLVDVLARTGALDRIALAAFSDTRLARLRQRLGPRLCTALGPLGSAALRLASVGVPGASAAVRRSGGGCAQLPLQTRGVPLVDARLVRRAHDLALPVHVWTVNDADEMRRLLELGVDGIMTDQPAVLKQVLIERGAWPAQEDQ